MVKFRRSVSLKEDVYVRLEAIRHALGLKSVAKTVEKMTFDWNLEEDKA